MGRITLTRRRTIRSLKDGPISGGRVNRFKKKDDGFRINREITVSEVRLIDEAGKMLGVMPTFRALTIAEERGYDLIEVAPDAKPPTCRIMDYGKWKYEAKKKAALSKKKQVVVVVKEIQVRPRTDEHDLETKIKHARRFLLEGDKVKINLRFQGRELMHQEVGMELLTRMTKRLEDLSVLESPPKREGKQMFVLLAPDPVKIKDYQKAHPEQAKRDRAHAVPTQEQDKDSANNA